jgi:choline dehydrogenase-like flavoprotein
MPKADLHELSPETEFACDVCIIGSGPAGATIARELAQSSLQVAVLESGGDKRQPLVDELNAIENIGWPRELDQWLLRNRIIGGSSHTWAGRCAPFDHIDFEERAWIPYSGWPFGLDEMRPYLSRTPGYVGLGVGADYTGDAFWKIAHRSRPQTALNEDLLKPFFWQYSQAHENRFDIMRFGPELVAHLPRNVRLITNATVVHLNVDSYGRTIQSVEAVSLDGQRHTIKARTIVLCAGGIENARLLLCSNKVEPNGVGNRRDVVGRFLMDHPRGTVGTFATSKSTEILRRFSLHHVSFASRTYRFRAGFRLSPAVQRREHLLNSAAWLDEVVPQDDPWRTLRHFLSGESRTAKDIRAIIANSDLLLKGAFDYVVRKRGLPRRLEALYLTCMSEQVPDPDSRVTLSDRTDRFGMPISRIAWKVNEAEERSIRRTAELVAEEVARLGYEPPKLESWVTNKEALPSSFIDIGHPTGTTRMSNDPAKGVVDAQCQVHGVDGLYVVGSSVFPTAGHANPTQMIVALAIRAADMLKARHLAACANAVMYFVSWLTECPLPVLADV